MELFGKIELIEEISDMVNEHSPSWLAVPVSSCSSTTKSVPETLEREEKNVTFHYS